MTKQSQKHAFARTLAKPLQDVAKQFPVVAITGPRQSGKTTLVRDLFPQHGYINFENLALLQAAKSDPQGFLDSQDLPIIIDEVQKYPDILSYIQIAVDEENEPGRFILTGSESLLLSEKISQSLAGRVANLTLLPFSNAELVNSHLGIDNWRQQILQGFYPRVYSSKLTYQEAYPEYITTYVERDVRSVLNIGDLSAFQRFLQLLAGRLGQVVNLSSLANDTGVSYQTIDKWLSVLEATYIAFRLPPYFKNFGKRVIKSPKIYFYDTGIAAALLGINSEKELHNHFALGALFENLIIADLVKEIAHQHKHSKLYYWRDRSGQEVDCLIDSGNRLSAIEIKSAATFNQDFLRNIMNFRHIADKPVAAFVVYGGTDELRLKDIDIIRWNSLKKIWRTVD